MQFSLLSIAYIVSSFTFIIGLKQLSHPDSARRGNIVAAIGMALAIFATIFLYEGEEGMHLHNLGFIFGGLIAGTIAGTYAARKVQMTQMPEMVSLFNGMGGACAALISLLEIKHVQPDAYLKLGIEQVPAEVYFKLIAIVSGLVIGTISFSGSMIAWAKLTGRLGDRTFRAQQMINIGLLGGILFLGIGIVIGKTFPNMIYLELTLCLLYGVLFTMPIGGADMPVVISLLNSFTGVAAACGGFLYNNNVMLTGGILVGSAGSILTLLMCRAMNRSLTNVIIGSFSSGGAAHDATREKQPYKEISLNDSAVMMSYAKKVIIVPGYGLAVAQAQHTCHELEKALEEKGVEVKYAIHPVAGRMPGHMNVLLAEADVPYPKLLEMDDANNEFSSADVVIILGANDVVNPAAKENKSSPIYGMPILEVEKAKQVIVNKRTMNTGYAGIDNDLFYRPKTSMLFGDAKSVLQRLIAEVKAS
jgi:NAD(P) transhydrogenase subunit beta